VVTRKKRKNVGGRPPAPPHLRRIRPVLLKFTESDYRAIKRVAKPVPVTTYIHRMVVEHVRRKKARRS
jgi:hypothetical protein